MLSKSLERGKVDFAIWIEKETSVDPTPINAKLVENYYHQIKDIAAQTGIPEPQDWFYTLLRMPDVETRIDTVVLTDEEWEIARKTIEEAVQALTDFRKQEGEALERKFNEKVDNIEALLHSIEPYEQQRVPKIKEKILEGLKQIPEVEYDKNRLEQELIYYIEKLDISEEKQRLTNHLKYFRETMRETGHGVGKKLGFIAQGDGARDQHDRFQEQPGGDAEHRRPHEGRAGADQGTSSQRTVIMEKGKLIIFSAPSGSGKSTIVSWLMEKHPELRLAFSISCTSRQPRGTERDGVEYFFLTPEAFRAKIERDEFLEYEEVYEDRFYGTLKAQVEAQAERGENVVFDVDVKGGCNIKRHYGQRALSIFIQPPSVEVLRERLVGRATDTPEAIEQRIAKAEYELTFAPQFDHCVVNDDLSNCRARSVQPHSPFPRQVN